MRKTPPRPELLKDTAIPRKKYLCYTQSGSAERIELNGSMLDDDELKILNDPATDPYLTILYSPDHPENAPLVYQYVIRKFFLTEHHQDERVVEVRLEPWSGLRQSDQRHSAPPIKVVAHRDITVLSNVTIRLIVTHDERRYNYRINSNARLNLHLGTIDL
jgi:hypothetical protein